MVFGELFNPWQLLFGCLFVCRLASLVIGWLFVCSFVVNFALLFSMFLVRNCKKIFEIFILSVKVCVEVCVMYQCIAISLYFLYLVCLWQFLISWAFFHLLSGNYIAVVLFCCLKVSCLPHLFVSILLYFAYVAATLPT